MPLADGSFGWGEALAAFAIIATAAFLVTWVFTDLLEIRRTAYVAILTFVVAALSLGYLAWSGTAWRDLVVDGWAWALLAGILAAGVMIPLVRRLPVHERAHGVAFGEVLAWEGFVYGVAEGVLLATLPVLAVWHAAVDLGWTETSMASVGAGVLAIAGSLLVIVVHHLGYVEFRGAGGRRMLVGALAACGVQAIAFLVTGNVLAPIVAHVILHLELLTHGDELPPARQERQLRLAA